MKLKHLQHLHYIRQLHILIIFLRSRTRTGTRTEPLNIFSYAATHTHACAHPHDTNCVRVEMNNVKIQRSTESRSADGAENQRPATREAPLKRKRSSRKHPLSALPGFRSALSRGATNEALSNHRSRYAAPPIECIVCFISWYTYSMLSGFQLHMSSFCSRPVRPAQRPMAACEEKENEG